MAVYDLDLPDSKPCRARAEDPALSGCTDPRAANYDAAAATNGGSCTYDCATLAAGGGGDAGCFLAGAKSDLPAPDLSLETAPASFVVQGRVDLLQTVTMVGAQQAQAVEGTGPYSYMGCFRDNEGGRDMGLELPFLGIFNLVAPAWPLGGRVEECAVRCGSANYQ